MKWIWKWHSIHPYVYVNLVVSCGNSYSLVVETAKINFFSFVIGIFDWPITKKIQQTLDKHKIDMLESPPLGCLYSYN
jgi:hypothetical protein